MGTRNFRSARQLFGLSLGMLLPVALACGGGGSGPRRGDVGLPSDGAFSSDTGTKDASVETPDGSQLSDTFADYSTPFPTVCELEEKVEQGPLGTSQVSVEIVAEGLEVPWSIAFLPNGDWLVTERPGRLRLLRGGVLLPTPVTEIATVDAGETGLLGVAVDPDYATNHFIFLFYTALKEGGGNINRLDRWKMSDDGLTATFDSRLLDAIPVNSVHTGGRIRIGPDAKLYVTTGDGGNEERAQDLAAINGKMLRLNTDGTIPSDNPTPGSPVFLMGLRNCEGFDWIGPHTLWVADHGPSGNDGVAGFDEVTSTGPGQNLGWPTIRSCEENPAMRSPSVAWRLSLPPGGLAVYTGTKIPEWTGDLFVGALKARHLHRLILDKSDRRVVTAREIYFIGDPPEGYGRIRELISAPDGYLYITTSNCDGRGTCPPEKDKILRVVKN